MTSALRAQEKYQSLINAIAGSGAKLKLPPGLTQAAKNGVESC